MPSIIFCRNLVTIHLINGSSLQFLGKSIADKFKLKGNSLKKGKIPTIISGPLPECLVRPTRNSFFLFTSDYTQPHGKLKIYDYKICPPVTTCPQEQFISPNTNFGAAMHCQIDIKKIFDPKIKL